MHKRAQWLWGGKKTKKIYNNKQWYIARKFVTKIWTKQKQRTICLRVRVRLEKFYLNLKMAWLLVADRLDWAHTDTHAHTPPYKHLFGLQRMVWKRENIQCAEVVWTKIPWSQRKMGRLVGDEIQLKLQYNQGVQNYISESRICRILNQMGDSSRWPHWMPVRWKQFKEKVQFQKIQ